MAVDVIMPVLGMTMESGVIVEWMKQEGESVSEGDVLFTVETDIFQPYFNRNRIFRLKRPFRLGR